MDTTPLTCQCCGGSMPPRDVWEANRDQAGECDGSVESRTGRCRAWSDSDLWTIGERMTAAADRFTDQLLIAWDSSDPYVATLEAGYLAEPDEDALRALCAETGEDYAMAEADVLSWVRCRVAQMS